MGWGGVVDGRSERPFSSGDRPVRLGGVVQRRHCGIRQVKKHSVNVIVQELCESRGGRPELSVLTSLLASVDVKIY